MAHKVLIVDDLEDNIFIMEKMMKRINLQTKSVKSGKEALETISEDDYSCILLDVMMPDMDGIECALKFKENPATKEIPIIFVSAMNKTNLKAAQADLLGDYFEKPFDSDKLCNKVIDVIYN